MDEDADHLYFTGIAEGAHTVRDARDLAMEDALAAAARHFGVRISYQISTSRLETGGTLLHMVDREATVGAALDPLIQGAYVQDTQVRPRDGVYDASVRLRYPKTAMRAERARLENQARDDEARAARAAERKRRALPATGSRIAVELDDKYGEGRDATSAIEVALVAALIDCGYTVAAIQPGGAQAVDYILRALVTGAPARTNPGAIVTCRLAAQLWVISVPTGETLITLDSGDVTGFGVTADRAAHDARRVLSRNLSELLNAKLRHKPAS